MISRLQMLIGLCTTQDLICIGHSLLATIEILTFFNENLKISNQFLDCTLHSFCSLQ